MSFFLYLLINLVLSSPYDILLITSNFTTTDFISELTSNLNGIQKEIKISLNLNYDINIL